MYSTKPTDPYQSHYYRDDAVESENGGEGRADSPVESLCGRTSSGPFVEVHEPVGDSPQDADDAGVCGTCAYIWRGLGDDAEDETDTAKASGANRL